MSHATKHRSDAYANVRGTDTTDGTELLGLQDVLRRMESELSQLRMAAWTQHKAQTQIQSMRFRTKAERAAVSVVLSNLHFKVSHRTTCLGVRGRSDLTAARPCLVALCSKASV